MLSLIISWYLASTLVGILAAKKLECYSPKEVTAVNTKVVETDHSTVVTNH